MSDRKGRRATGGAETSQTVGLYDPSLHIFVDDAEVHHMANVHRVWLELRLHASLCSCRISEA